MVLLVLAMMVAMLVASGAALAENIILCSTHYCEGTKQSETMAGYDNIIYEAHMFAYGGNDAMYGKGGPDSMVGGTGTDELRGGPGNDHLYGSGGDLSDTGDDYLYGGDGSDQLYGGDAEGGVDRLFAGKGNDLVFSANGDAGLKEIIDCGGGSQDEVYFDKGLDVVTNCEIKHDGPPMV